MRRLITLIILAAFVAALPAFAARPTFPTQNGVPVQANFGCIEISTPTISLTDVASVAPDLSDYLPSGTQGFWAHTEGVVILADEDNIATSGASTGYIGYKIASGSTFKWEGLAGTFNGKIIADSTSATFTLDIAW